GGWVARPPRTAGARSPSEQTGPIDATTAGARPAWSPETLSGHPTGSVRTGTFRAEREGFEPSVGVLPLHTLSRRAPSTTRSPLPYGRGARDTTSPLGPPLAKPARGRMLRPMTPSGRRLGIVALAILVACVGAVAH